MLFGISRLETSTVGDTTQEPLANGSTALRPISVHTAPLKHRASSCMRLFRSPVLPELFRRAGDFRNMTSIWDQSSNEEAERYISVFRHRGAVTAALNWYRRIYRVPTGARHLLGPARVPTLYLRGT
jgi:hypothetical protein